MANTRLPTVLSVAIEGEEWQRPRVGTGNATRRRRPDCRQRVRAQCDLLSRMLLRLLPPVDWTSIFVAVPPRIDCPGLARFRPAIERRRAGVVFRRIRVYLLALALELGAEVLRPHCAAGVLVHVARGNAFVLLVRNNPRVIGAVSLPVTIALAICAWLAHSRTPDREPTSLYSTTGRAFFRYLAPLSDSLSVGDLAEYRLLQACFGPSAILS
mgnify:CR=1 FL=1